MTNPIRKGHSLSKVLSRVQQLFDEQISPHEVWVKAEISSYRKHASGHHYFDFVEERNQSIVARCKANLWRGQADAIEARTRLVLSELLEDGRELLCLCRLIYHPVFGLSLNVVDIDPNFTLGEIERRRQEAIEQLKKQGLLHLNRALPLPRVVQNIAIIAAEGSAGLADLQNQLESNAYGFHFHWDHYNALVQGVGSPASIIRVFQSIDQEQYDAIVLIRGGGSALDLDAFNDLEMNRILAQSSLPFLVGIGHETDRTVVDEWAAKSLKTPSAVGAWIVERARDFEVEVSTSYQSILEEYRSRTESEKAKSQDRLQQIVHFSRSSLSHSLHFLETQSRNVSVYFERFSRIKREKLNQSTSAMGHLSRDVALEARHAIEARTVKMDRFATETLVRSKSHLELTRELVELYHPQSTLKRGYTYLRIQGKVASDTENVRLNEEIEIIAHNKEITALVKEIRSKKNG